MLSNLKLGAIGALALALFAGGFYLGGMRSKTALEGFQAAQAEATAKAVLAERASAAAELARVNGILKGYEDAALTPIPVAVGLSRVVLEHACPSSGAVPAAGADPGRAVRPAAKPDGDPESERLLQAVFDACEADARELTALQAAWPR